MINVIQRQNIPLFFLWKQKQKYCKSEFKRHLKKWVTYVLRRLPLQLMRQIREFKRRIRTSWFSLINLIYYYYLRLLVALLKNPYCKKVLVNRYNRPIFQILLFILTLITTIWISLGGLALLYSFFGNSYRTWIWSLFRSSLSELRSQSSLLFALLVFWFYDFSGNIWGGHSHKELYQ